MAAKRTARPAELVRPKLELSVPFSAYQELMARYDALVHELIGLKRDGFAPTVDLPQAPQEEPLPELVRKAISELPADLEGHLVMQAWALLRGGMEVEQVAAKITAGEEAEL